MVTFTLRLLELVYDALWEPHAWSVDPRQASGSQVSKHGAWAKDQWARQGEARQAWKGGYKSRVLDSPGVLKCPLPGCPGKKLAGVWCLVAATGKLPRDAAEVWVAGGTGCQGASSDPGLSSTQESSAWGH